MSGEGPGFRIQEPKPEGALVTIEEALGRALYTLTRIADGKLEGDPFNAEFARIICKETVERVVAMLNRPDTRPVHVAIEREEYRNLVSQAVDAARGQVRAEQALEAKQYILDSSIALLTDANKRLCELEDRLRVYETADKAKSAALKGLRYLSVRDKGK